MSVEEARSVIHDATSIPAIYLTDDASIHRTPMWDSLMSLKILLLVEERFGQVPSEVQFSEFTSLISLAKLLEKLQK